MTPLFRLRSSCIHLSLVLAAWLALTSLGCNLEVPEDGVQVIVEQKLRDDQMEILKVRLERMRDEGGGQSAAYLTIDDSTKINLSPVADVAGFAERVDFAEVTSVEGRVVHLTLNLERL